jgi:hypothetical protein
VLIVLLVKYKRRKRTPNISTPVNILLEANTISPEPLPLDEENYPENPVYTELDVNRVHGRNTMEDGTYQKLVKRDSDYVIPAERRDTNEDIKMGRNLQGYEELDLSKREADDYQKLMKT